MEENGGIKLMFELGSACWKRVLNVNMCYSKALNETNREEDDEN